MDAHYATRLADRRAPPFLAPLAALILVALIGVAWHGFRAENLFSQDLWRPLGLQRFAHYTGAFLALAVPLLLIAPWAFAGLITGLLLLLSIVALGPPAVLATGFFLLSACALGSRVLRAKDDSPEDHLLATLLGMGVYIFLMTFLARQPVNYPWFWGSVLAVPVLLDLRGVARRLRCWLRLVCTAELRSAGERAAFAALVFILAAHWFTAIKPEVGADGLAMHLAIPLDMVEHHRMTFEPSRFVWAVMPMGADWCYSIVALMGGEFAARLLVWCMLAVIVALLYCTMRRLVSPAAAWFLAALFATTPLVQLVTGSLFVENMLAAMILGTMAALWRFSETASTRYLYAAMALGGTAMAVKLGALAFLFLALAYAVVETVRLWRRLGPRPWLVLAGSLALLIATAAPMYSIAYIKTGNPVFPFFNQTYPSPLLAPDVDLRNYDYHQPVKWNTLYRMIFRSAPYYEGQNGAFGFQHLPIVPMAWLSLLVVRRKIAVTAALIGSGAAILVLRSEPNLRYLYWTLPLITVGFAGFFGWLEVHRRWLYGFMTLILAACAALNIWFLPSSSYYHKEFSMRMPFSRAAREQYLRAAAPVRDVIAYFNRTHAGSVVLFTHTSDIAGISADIYENHWHQWPIFERILKTKNLPDMMDLMKAWKVQYFIAQKPGPGVLMWSRQLAKLLESCTASEYERGDMYLARLDVSCKAGAHPPAWAPPGFYDDFYPGIVFRGQWHRDEQFADAAEHTISYAGAPGAEVEFPFEGKALSWVFTSAPNRGIAEVTIDGVRKGLVDLYSAGIEWRSQKRYCCLSPGKHVAVIRVTGQRHTKSTGGFVDVDGFVVE